MKPVKLRELSLDQLLDIQGEHFADNFEQGKQGDAYSNHVNRHVVWALHRKHGQAFLGRICYKPGDALSPIREWEGERIDAFSADFAIPSADAVMVDLITTWNATGNVERLFDIHARIDQLGGVMLHWFTEPGLEESQDRPQLQIVG
jgi:hypothetical protein